MSSQHREALNSSIYESTSTLLLNHQADPVLGGELCEDCSKAYNFKFMDRAKAAVSVSFRVKLGPGRFVTEGAGMSRQFDEKILRFRSPQPPLRIGARATQLNWLRLSRSI
eukprot:6207195-Pleurochrysis_carterae.AAC.13